MKLMPSDIQMLKCKFDLPIDWFDKITKYIDKTLEHGALHGHTHGVYIDHDFVSSLSSSMIFGKEYESITIPLDSSQLQLIYDEYKSRGFKIHDRFYHNGVDFNFTTQLKAFVIKD